MKIMPLQFVIGTTTMTAITLFLAVLLPEDISHLWGLDYYHAAIAMGYPLMTAITLPWAIIMLAKK